MDIFNTLSLTMPTVGPVVNHGQYEESLLIGKVHLFPNLAILTISSLNVMYCNSASAHKTITPIKTETFLMLGVVRWS